MKTKLNLSERVKQSKTGKQLVYVLECIENSSHAADCEITFATDYDKIKMFFEGFDNEFNYEQNKIRYKNLQNRIGEWLRGLPSYIAIDYTWNDITTNGKKWGYCTTERNTEEFINNWFNMIALRLLQIAEKVGYNTKYLH